MDYFKVNHLLFLILAIKLIAAQNLNNLSYGELSEQE